MLIRPIVFGNKNKPPPPVKGRNILGCVQAVVAKGQHWSEAGRGKVTVRVSLVLVAKSCPNLYKPMDCSLPCSSVYGIFQAKILEWVAISSSRGSS